MKQIKILIDNNDRGMESKLAKLDDRLTAMFKMVCRKEEKSHKSRVGEIKDLISTHSKSLIKKIESHKKPAKSNTLEKALLQRPTIINTTINKGSTIVPSPT